MLINPFNCKIIDYSAGKNKDANLVIQAFLKVNRNLKQISLFHTEHRNECKNRQIDNFPKHLESNVLLVGKVVLMNAAAESTYKIIKTKFIKQNTFTPFSNCNCN